MTRLGLIVRADDRGIGNAVLATLAEASERLERYRAAAAREGWRP